MPGKVTLTILDHSNETSRVGFHLPDMSAANYEAVSGDGVGQSVGELRLALNPLILGNHLRRTVVSDLYLDAATLPTNGAAQRERKARFTYRDTVNARLGAFEIPTFDSETYATPGTDVLDITQTDIAAMITAVETHAVSRDGNAIEVLSGQIVGRNI